MCYCWKHSPRRKMPHVSHGRACGVSTHPCVGDELVHCLLLLGQLGLQGLGIVLRPPAAHASGKELEWKPVPPLCRHTPQAGQGCAPWGTLEATQAHTRAPWVLLTPLLVLTPPAWDTRVPLGHSSGPPGRHLGASVGAPGTRTVVGTTRGTGLTKLELQAYQQL